MRRKLIATATQVNSGTPFTATFDTPPPAEAWLIVHLTVELPNYTAAGVKAGGGVLVPSGAVSAIVTLDGAFLMGTNQGQGDSADGVAFTVHAGQVLAVTWNPSGVPGTVQGRATLWVDQVSESRLMGTR